MAGIRGKDTRPELLIRRGLYARGLRYRLHVSGMPGRPDIVLPRFWAVIFIHGCFWHAHERCRYFRLPKTRTEFWTAKLEGNRQRDLIKSDLLKTAGWRVLTVWECATKAFPVDSLVNAVVSWLHGDDHTGEIAEILPQQNGNSPDR